MAELVQYRTVSLQNLGSWRGAHPNAAELELYQLKYATFPLSALRNSGITGTVRHCVSTKHRFLERRSPECRRVSTVPVKVCHFSSKRVEEQWHNWYSLALFLYKTAAPGEALTRMPQS